TSAAVIIPAGFTESIIPAAGQTEPGEVRQIEVYTNPARPTSAGIIQTIVEEFMGRVEIGKIGGEVAIEQLLESGLLQPDPQALAAAGEELGKQIAGDEASFNAINIQKTRAVNEATQFNIMAYMAPGMALMFLMLTVAYGGRSLLTERAQGTLPRLLVSPTA